MEPIYVQNFEINDMVVDRYGYLKPSMLLLYAQTVATQHGELMEVGRNVLLPRRMFWAIIRHRVQITRLPCHGETIRIETWPMPATRSSFPRSVIAYDESGNECFRAISLWVLMDLDKRSMILPGKSGVTVDGVTVGNEIAVPASLPPAAGENVEKRQVRFTDLDVNGHMNNTQYLNWVDDLLPGVFHRDHPAKEFTICYLNEALEGQTLELNWELGDELRVDAQCQDTEDPAKTRRIFATKVKY